MTPTEPLPHTSRVIRRLDPRARILATFMWSMAIAVIGDVRVLAVGLCVAGVVLVATGLEPRPLWRRLALINLFIALLWLFLPWSVPGEPVARIGGVSITTEGLLLALRLSLRCNAIVWVCLALLGTCRLADVVWGLQALRTPNKLVLLLFFCVSYIQVIREEYQRMAAAIELRAFKPRVALSTYRTYANLVGLLLVRSHDRATRVHEAMVCRAFDGRLRVLREGRLRGRDLAVAGGLTGAALILLVWACMTAN